MLSEQDTNTGDLNVISLKKYLDMETHKSDEPEPNDLARAALESFRSTCWPWEKAGSAPVLP